MRLSEQMRLMIALSDRIELDRASAIKLMKVVEVFEQNEMDMQAMTAELIHRENRRDDVLKRTIIDIVIVCWVVVCMSWLI